MRTAARYCITAGVALGGVSVIVAAPAAPPLRDIQVPAVHLSGNSHENPDVNTPSVADLLQVMSGVEGPIVIQNITEPDGTAAHGGQPADVPGLSDLLNLGIDPAGGQPGKSFVDLTPPTAGDLTAPPASPPPPPGS
ncbi:hypothetical protein [Candidatus Mycobacterium methanotrophicum]|uniref:Uncharacterized protein n=1 Tax=Candidatus Mycobacterium methanotrophicum TaxID=2943498 RepID=A0ABY4QLG3_9MYCO|nr:hypothetical protein [Candidatus Mycobacterium methanotrophicum]UQX10638.1 hypothetical protein M5I08_21895 [Candidatus Mycobacterium methanotrophicum]